MATTSDVKSQGSGDGAPSGVFLRSASGVYRSWSTIDGFIYNVFAINVVATFTFALYQAGALFPGGNLVLATVICGILCVFEGIAYAILLATMPRSGGDYLFQTRILGGWTTIFTFTSNVLTQAVYVGLITFTAVNIILQPYLAILGQRLGWDWMISLGDWMMTNTGYAVVGIIVVVWGWLTNVFGMRLYALLQRWCFWIGVALFGVVLVILAFMSKDTFVAHFNGYMLQTEGVKNAYQMVLDTAAKAGYQVGTPFSWGATFKIIPIVVIAFMFLQWGAAQGGEIKSGSSLRAQLFQMPGAVVFSTILAAVLSLLLMARIGTDFLGAAGYLYISAPDQYTLPFSPLWGTFVSVLFNNTFLILLVAIMFQAWFWMWYQNAQLAGSRVLLAMAFDREIPAWFGKINPRTVTPVNALICLSSLGLVFAMLVAFTTFENYLLSVIVPSILCFGLTCLAAAIMPWRRPQLYKDSPANEVRVLGIPLVTLAGAIFFVFAVWTAYMMLSDSIYGVNGKTPLTVVADLYVFSAAIYVWARINSKRKDLDLDKAYAQIPLE
jgi:basic amino acid/polyamine antiporter, APA family